MDIFLLFLTIGRIKTEDHSCRSFQIKYLKSKHKLIHKQPRDLPRKLNKFTLNRSKVNIYEIKSKIKCSWKQNQISEECTPNLTQNGFYRWYSCLEKDFFVFTRPSESSSYFKAFFPKNNLLIWDQIKKELFAEPSSMYKCFCLRVEDFFKAGRRAGIMSSHITKTNRKSSKARL